MKDKGFTLVELLGVVTILAMLGLIITPVTVNIIKENKEKLYDTQIRNIKQGASNFVSENVFILNIGVNEQLGIRLGKLKELGYIESDIKDPITRKKFSDDLVVIISKTEKGYDYTVCTTEQYCRSDVNMY